MPGGAYTFTQSSLAVLIALYLDGLGFSLVQIGAFLSAGVAGSAFFSFVISLIAEKVGRRRLLVTFPVVSAAAGLALVFCDNFLPLLSFAFVGNLGSSYAAGPAQPLEQASLPNTAPIEKRTDLSAIYRIIATGSAALGALASGLPPFCQSIFGMSEIAAYEATFVGYALFLLIYDLSLYSIFRDIKAPHEPPKQAAKVPSSI